MSRPVIRDAWALLALGLVVGGGLSGCVGPDDPDNAVQEGELGASVTADDVLGFETASGWSAVGAEDSSTSIRTQGNAALEIASPAEVVTLTSQAVSSDATALTGLGDESSSLAIDVMLPALDAKERNGGSLEVFVSSRSRKLVGANLGRASFAGLAPSIYHTLTFAIPDRTRRELASAPVKDLVFVLALHAHDRSSPFPQGRSLTYRIDHLRVHAPSQAPVGVHESVDLVALRTYAPPASTPGAATFEAGVVQVPESFHVKTGSGKGGSAQLELGFDAKAFVTCSYPSSADGASYVFSACTDGSKPGNLLGASWARLTILDGDASAGTTKVRAQLAKNPVGDLAGVGIIPPMPTFWGDTPESANQIVTTYFDAVHATAPQGTVQVSTPVPDFARRHGDGSPHDNLSGVPPPTPDDPPFDQEGHLNNGGNWDAYWRLSGNITPTRTADNRFKNHFEATMSANAVLWGYDKSIVAVKAQADSDSGQVQANGINQPSASGGVKLYLLGLEAVSREVTPETQFSFEEELDRTFPIATVQIWIFQIALKVNVNASFSASGAITPVDVAFQVTPGGSIGAILSGGVNIGIAKGTVDAQADMLRLSTPVRARAGWFISTDPSVCSARLFIDLTGAANLSSLGGKVDLNATLGACPFCYEDSYNLFNWSPLASAHFDLFDFTVDGQLFPLPGALCEVPLTVTIAKPLGGEAVSAGVPYVLQGKAVRPATPGADEQAIDCQRLTWTSSEASDVGFPATGCTPQVTFGPVGSRTLTLTATSSSGEQGSTTRIFDVVAASSGPSPFIGSPHDGDIFGVFSCTSGPVALTGGAVGGTGAVALKWTITPLDGGGDISISNDTSANATLDLPGGPGGQEPKTYRLTLTATDGSGATNSASLTITTVCFL